MKVQYHKLEEFLDELAKDQEQIHRRIVRAMSVRRFHTNAPTRFYFIVSYRIGDDLISVEHHLGDSLATTWENEIETRRRECVSRLEGLCKDLGLQVRGGIME